HYDAIVIDTHNDIMMQVMEKGIDITKENSSTQSDLIRMVKGGLDVQVFSIYVPAKYKKNHFSYVNNEIDKLEEIASNHPDKLSIAYDYSKLIVYLSEGKTCGLLGGEGGTMIEGSLEKLEHLYKRGLRYLTLTWNNSNQIATSSRDEAERNVKGGLTEFGKTVIEKMDELGMFIDVSHLGETAFWDVINLSKNPVIASHSCVYNLNPHYRNLKDEQIKAIAKSGGVIFINFYSKFLDPGAVQGQSYYQKYRPELNELANKYGNDLITYNKERIKFIENHPLYYGTSIDKLIEHIDYVTRLVGVNYVGLGSDFDGEVFTPNELYDATCYPLITKKLVDRGYKEEEIRKILGLNFLRIFKQISK
ncbi:MAG: dipeptidase, partial [Ignavibacteria bacterium]